jgi:hypothetical protein
MAMSTLASEVISSALDDLLLRQDVSGANITLCVLLGVERSNTTLFEGHLAVLLRQIQVAAFAVPVRSMFLCWVVFAMNLVSRHLPHVLSWY